MKKIICILALVQATMVVSAQVTIGKALPDGSSTILDFENAPTNTYGIILPALENTPTGLTADNNGTLIYDRTQEKVRMYNNNTWVDLSDQGDSSSIDVNTSLETSSAQGVIIGADTSAAEGVLVLESSDKAIILPKVNRPHENVKSPYPGMICYDTESKTLAVFDGVNWSYWK